MAFGIQIDASGLMQLNAAGEIVFGEPGDPCCCGEPTCAYCSTGPVGTTALVSLTGFVDCGCEAIGGDSSQITVFNVNTNYCLDRSTDPETPCNYSFAETSNTYFEATQYVGSLCLVPVGGTFTGVEILLIDANPDLNFEVYFGGQLVLSGTMAGPLDCTAPIVIDSTTASVWTVYSPCGTPAYAYSVSDATNASIVLTFDGC